MRAFCLSLTAVALVFGLSPAPRAASPVQAANPFQWRGNILQGHALEIKGVNGDVKATASPGAEVEVSAVMRGRRNNPADVRIDVVQHSDGITLCAVYPDADSRPNECQPGEGGRMNVRDNDVTVTFTARVPAGVRFIGRTVNGDVSAEGLGAAVALRTVNGQVNFSTSSYGEASTVNGSIHGTIGNALWSEPLEFKSVNGSITLDLPGDASAEVKARTVNGSISTDFPIAVRGKVDPRSLNGTIGGGGRTIALETVNGSVTLRKR